MKLLEGKNVIITGASRGIGMGIAKVFADHGANIAFTYSSSEAPALALEKELSSKGVKAKAYKSNAANFEEADVLVNQVLKDFDGVIDVLINNAGMLDPIKKIGTYTAEAVSMNVQVNLTAPMVLSNKFVAAYQQLNCKKLILNISSGAGKYPIDGWSAYCATKSGLDMFSTVMHAEQNLLSNVYGRVKVVSLSPGIIDTEMQADIRSSKAEDFSQVERFVDYKKSGELQSSIQTAEKIISKLHTLYHREEVICSLRDE